MALKNNFQIISQQNAKQIIDSEKNIIILDVRHQFEYEEKHIPNSILIDLCNLSDQAHLQLPNKKH